VEFKKSAPDRYAYYATVMWMWMHISSFVLTAIFQVNQG